MRLSPDEMIFWHYGFMKLNATIVFTWAFDARACCRFKAHNPQAFPRPEAFPLARTFWK